jgi:branched-subunit amino acid transport protein
MTAVWITVLLVGIVSVSIKGAGPTVLGGRTIPVPVQRVIALLAPTLLAALVVTQIFSNGRSYALDARAAGLVTGAVCIALRLPLLVIIVLAAAAAAITRGIA